MRAKLIPAALAVLCLTGCDWEDLGGLERFNRDFHYSYPLKSTGSLAVETFNGSVEISGWDQETVDISGTKYGPSQQAADDLPVEIDHTPEAVSIRVTRPIERRGNRGARFAIKIPRGARLDRIVSSNGGIHTLDGTGPAHLRTSNGTIHVRGLRGALDAQTSNGAVELLDVDGDVTAHSSNGRIRAEGLRGALDATTSNSGIIAKLERAEQSVRVETSNGSIDLALPPGFRHDVRAHTSNSGITLRLPPTMNAQVSAHTSNSSVSSDFDMRMQGAFSRSRMEGVIGSGGPLIDLSTSNGSIRLVKI
jgi:DUF4097 and DUF4098 domain-containing protein YvlB